MSGRNVQSIIMTIQIIRLFTITKWLCGYIMKKLILFLVLEPCLHNTLKSIKVSFRERCKQIPFSYIRRIQK